jgi:transcriptional regulator with XRE-family HTH domain
MPLGTKMRAARLAAKKTQEQIAEHLDVTKGAVSQWETEETVPELEYFRDFCLFTKASADEILLERNMDPLLRQLVNIWDRLSPDGRDSLLGNANRLLTEEHPEIGEHNPFGRLPPKSPTATKPANQGKKHRPS